MLLNNFNLIKNNFFSNIDKDKFVIHFIGIGGCGMSGIAEFLALSGYKITGSDIKYNSRIKYLISIGVKYYFNHNKNNVLNTSLVVYSSAIKMDNPEIIFAKLNGIFLVRRIDILYELIRWYYSIVIVGTHGKTTTTALIFDLLFYNGIKVNCINGGNIKSINSYIYLSDCNYFLLELDESDRVFLNFKPIVTILTSIDYDHLNNYNNKISNLINSFVNYLNNVPFYGLIIACIDDPFVRKLLNDNSFQCKIITYGFSEDADYRVINFIQMKNRSNFSLFIKNNLNEYNLSLNVFGKHNVLNSVAAICLILNFKQINYVNLQKSLNNFKGVKRRSEFIGKYYFNYKGKIIKNISIIFDYGHHPKEIDLNINSIRNSWLNKRLVVIFQPHRFSRTINLFIDFIKVLCKIDILLLLDIYAANEKNICKNINSNSLISKMYDIYGYKNSVYLKDTYEVMKYFFYIIRNNDIVVLQGAGEIDFLLYNLILKYCIK